MKRAGLGVFHLRSEGDFHPNSFFSLSRWELAMIRKLKDGRYRLYSRKTDPKTKKRRNLGTFASRAAAEKHERQVQFFKRRG